MTNRFRISHVGECIKSNWRTDLKLEFSYLESRGRGSVFCSDGSPLNAALSTVFPQTKERNKLEALKKKLEQEEERMKKMEDEKKKKQEELRRSVATQKKVVIFVLPLAISQWINAFYGAPAGGRKREERLRRVNEAKVKEEQKEEQKKKKIEQKMAQIDEKNDKVRVHLHRLASVWCIWPWMDVFKLVRLLWHSGRSHCGEAQDNIAIWCSICREVC